MLRVLLTHPPSTHTYYSEMVASPPCGISYVWSNRLDFAGRQRVALETVASFILRWLALPNIRVLSGSSNDQIDLTHSCQNILLSSGPWVVDIEHGCPFV